MGSYMIWRLTFKDNKAKIWFEKKFLVNLIHDHYEGEFGYGDAEFYYDAGFNGYMESEEIAIEMEEKGIIKFEELCLCDTDDFKVKFPKLELPEEQKKLIRNIDEEGYCVHNQKHIGVHTCDGCCKNVNLEQDAPTTEDKIGKEFNKDY